jgi:hypothetical protein
VQRTSSGPGPWSRQFLTLPFHVEPSLALAVPNRRPVAWSTSDSPAHDSPHTVGRPGAGRPKRRLDRPANRVDTLAHTIPSAGVVTTLSQLGANRGTRPETARDGLCWSENFETHCKTTKSSRCPTGGQVVTGSNPGPATPNLTLPRQPAAPSRQQDVVKSLFTDFKYVADEG